MPRKTNFPPKSFVKAFHSRVLGKASSLLLLSTALKNGKNGNFSPKLRPGFPVTGPKCQLMNNSGTEEVFIGTGPDVSAQKEDF